MNKIRRIFDVIGTILPQVNKERKRMINLKFIIKKVLEMLGLPHDKIKISRSKKTLTTYQEYWDNILLLVGDEIQSIVRETPCCISSQIYPLMDTYQLRTLT